MKSYTIILLLCTSFSLPLAAQVQTDSVHFQKSYWAEIGFGLSFPNTRSVGFQGTLGVQIGKKFTAILNRQLSIGLREKAAFVPSHIYFGLGSSTKSDKWFSYLTVGPSYIHYYYQEEFVTGYSSVSKNKVGVMVSGAVYFCPNKRGGRGGLGLSGYLNINSEKPYAGISFSYAFGSLNVRKNY